MHKKAPVLESLFNKVADLKDLQLQHKEAPTQVFLVNVAKFLPTTFFRTPPVAAFVSLIK